MKSSLRQVRVFEILQSLPPGYPNEPVGNRISFREVAGSSRNLFGHGSRTYRRECLEQLITDKLLQLVETSDDLDEELAEIEAYEAAA